MNIYRNASSSVVIEETIESPADSGSSDSEKRQTSPTIEGFTLVLALLTVIDPLHHHFRRELLLFLLSEVSILLFY